MVSSWMILLSAQPIIFHKLLVKFVALNFISWFCKLSFNATWSTMFLLLGSNSSSPILTIVYLHLSYLTSNDSWFYPRMKWTLHKADHSPSFSVNAMSVWSHTSIPPTHIHAYPAPKPTTINSKFTPISHNNDPSITLTLSEIQNPQQILVLPCLGTHWPMGPSQWGGLVFTLFIHRGQ